MEARIKELQQIISDTEESLKDPNITSDVELVSLLNEELDKAKKELESLQKKAEEEVKKAEGKIEEAKKEGDKSAEKEAKKELADAKKDEKELEKIEDKIEKTEAKVEKAEEKAEKHGGTRRGAGRPPKKDKVEKVKKPRGGFRPKAGRKPMVKTELPEKAKRVLVKPKKMKEIKKLKSVRAFGQTVEFKSDAEFCKKLIRAFKKRRTVYKAKKRRTKSVFGIILGKVKDSASKAISNVPKKEIAKNPKMYMAKFQRLEKASVEYLEAFKDVLGSEFKKSEVVKEFGIIDASVKQLIKKYTKK